MPCRNCSRGIRGRKPRAHTRDNGWGFGDGITVSEVRALLLTDVVDSAQLSERLGEAKLAALWAAHDRLARDLLPARRGREIDKTDGMLLLFEAAADAEADAAFVPPPDAAKGYRVVREGDMWLPARNIKRSLPAERDSFVGRRETLVELARRLDAGARLVSVLGIGGSGKTRLVTRFGWSWLGDFPGGVWFCDLSQARSLDGIVHAVAEALAVPLGKEEPVRQLGNAIAARGPCLVILDNFEQVSRYAEEALGRWLSRATEARFVVTTREVLGLAGEETLALAPLPAADAAALFVQRAESAKRDFQPTEEDRAAVDPLVKLLEGLPLAIELAAARVRVMPPRTLLSRMSERFKLLSSTGGRRDRPVGARRRRGAAQRVLRAPRREARGGGGLRGNRQPRGRVPAGSGPGCCRRIRGRAGGRLGSAQFARAVQRGRGARV